MEKNCQPVPQKPKSGEPCNGCGYCCAVQPCMLAQEFLKCTAGPCVALETREGKSSCGLVRNPLGYLFKVAHPDKEVPLDDVPDIEVGKQLSNDLAATLGIGLGCDTTDDDDSAAWPESISTPLP